MVGGRVKKVEGEVMEIMTLLFFSSMVGNVVLLYLLNREIEDHIRTLNISAAFMKHANKRIKELKEKLKGGELNDEETSR